MHQHLRVALFIPLLFLFTPTLAAEPFEKRPKLILLIVIDQFRADLITRFQSEFLPPRLKNGNLGGFRYLTTQGAYFPFAKYDVLQCMTGPGHATVLTGAYPYRAGIPVNDWYDQETQSEMYCAEDTTHPTVGAVPKERNPGTSPKNLLATTLGDEMKNANFPSRMISIALKDRASIFMGGHRADLALWMDKASSNWVSSKYYLPDGKLPGWVSKLNEKRAGKPVNQTSAEGLEVTVDAVEAAFEEYRLGKGQATDVLAVSFSSHDYVGHKYGSNGDEIRQITLADDKMISKLLTLIQNKVPGGMSNTVVVLTGDHGVASYPEYLKDRKIPAGRIDEAQLVPALNEHLIKKFGKPDGGQWVPVGEDFNYYFNHAALKKEDISLEEMENEAKKFLTALPGVAFAFSGTDVQKRQLPPIALERNILKTYMRGRSGDVVVIPKGYWITDGYLATHQTSYAYDCTVPLIFAGFQVKRGVHATAAEVVDIAPTLSYLLGLVPPSMNEGRVLSEALSPQ